MVAFDNVTMTKEMNDKEFALYTVSGLTLEAIEIIIVYTTVAHAQILKIILCSLKHNSTQFIITFYCDNTMPLLQEHFISRSIKNNQNS